MSALAFEHVTLAVGRRTVLADVSFAIETGAFVGVFGPNGAGKTTLFRACLGLLPPVAGRITIGGAAPCPGRVPVGYLPQARGTTAPRGLTGADWVGAAWHGARPGLPWRDGQGRHAVDRALLLADALDLADRPVARLSGGERQRLRLAQALLGEPALLLLDEPLISLDPGRGAATVSLAKRLSAEHGITVLFSAHELNPLASQLDRVLYLGNGRAVLGTVTEVITGPVLSALYGTPVEVVRADGRLFVLAGGVPVDPAGCGGGDHQHHRRA